MNTQNIIQQIENMLQICMSMDCDPETANLIKSIARRTECVKRGKVLLIPLAILDSFRILAKCNPAMGKALIVPLYQFEKTLRAEYADFEKQMSELRYA